MQENDNERHEREELHRLISQIPDRHIDEVIKILQENFIPSLERTPGERPSWVGKLKIDDPDLSESIRPQKNKKKSNTSEKGTNK